MGKKKYVVRTITSIYKEKYPMLCCVKHDGLHPFMWKKPDEFRTSCGETLTKKEFLDASDAGVLQD